MHIDSDKNKMDKGLYIVSTPIGNLNDITIRAIAVLKNSDYILCEDTRVTKKLTKHFKINTKLISNHKFNERKNIKKILSLFEKSRVISLVSDAGTPLISDPGNLIINECIQNNIKIIPVPGVSSVTAAISVSAFSNNFYFHGFLSDRKKEKEKELSSLSNLNSSIIFFISAKKFDYLIPRLKHFFFDRKIVICKELTKFYEQIFRGNINDLDNLNINIKGEFTIVISEKNIRKINKETLEESVKIRIRYLINKLSIKDIVKIIGLDKNISKSIIYKYCLDLKNDK